MIRSISAAVMAVFLWQSSQAFAAECLPIDTARDLEVGVADDISVCADLRGDEAVAFVKYINSLPPPTAFEADQVYILQQGASAGVRLILGRDGCARTAFFLKRKYLLEGMCPVEEGA